LLKDLACTGVVGAEAKRGLVVRDRLGDAVLLGEGIGQIEVGVEIGRV
jgi:hypothetical protein